MDKSVPLTDLLNSDVFVYQFDFDEWPSTHQDENKYIRPYNGKIFGLRNQYRSIFFEDKFEIVDENLA